MGNISQKGSSPYSQYLLAKASFTLWQNGKSSCNTAGRCRRANLHRDPESSVRQHGGLKVETYGLDIVVNTLDRDEQSR